MTRELFVIKPATELNPDKYLNWDLKAGVHSATPLRNQEQSKKTTISHMRMLQKKPKKVRNMSNIRRLLMLHNR